MKETKHPGRGKGGLTVAGNLALLLISVVLILVVLEAGVRLVMSFDRNYLDELINYHPGRGDSDLLLGDFIRPVADDLLVYEMRPGARGRFHGHELSINSLGMRDRERSPDKPPDVFRIVGLGDSHMFGWGVRMGEAFPAVLEKMLNERYDGRRFEVFNLAVPGYNTVQEVQDFFRRADDLDPDLVIINYVDNDMDLPNFLSERPDLWTSRKSYLADFVRRRIAVLRGSHLLHVNLTPVAPEENTLRFRMQEDRIPERFRPLYGRENMIAAYDRLGRLARDRGIPYVLLFNMDDYRFRLRGRTPTVLPYLVRDLARICAEKGFLVVDPQDRIARYLEENGLGTLAVWVSEKDSHSNAIRHRFVAEELLERIEAAGLLPEDAAPRRPGS